MGLASDTETNGKFKEVFGGIPYPGADGRVNTEKSCTNFCVVKFSDIDEKILPFFDKYPLIGKKSKDSSDIRKVAEIMKVKGHLTAEGLEQILKIKKGMNTGRDWTEV